MAKRQNAICNNQTSQNTDGRTESRPRLISEEVVNRFEIKPDVVNDNRLDQSSSRRSSQSDRSDTTRDDNIVVEHVQWKFEVPEGTYVPSSGNLLDFDLNDQLPNDYYLERERKTHPGISSHLDELEARIRFLEADNRQIQNIFRPWNMCSMM